jgi:hypothetical protein
MQEERLNFRAEKTSYLGNGTLILLREGKWTHTAFLPRNSHTVLAHLGTTISTTWFSQAADGCRI